MIVQVSISSSVSNKNVQDAFCYDLDEYLYKDSPPELIDGKLNPIYVQTIGQTRPNYWWMADELCN